MTTGNPFPGMNPFMEQCWRDAHTTLITYARDALQEVLPPDLVAAAEEEVVGIGGGDTGGRFRPDVQVRQPWEMKDSGLASPAEGPVHVLLDDDVERWVEIREPKGRLVTVIELLSPGNKLELDDRERYRHKRECFCRSGVNLVEIDLVRRGASVFPRAVREFMQQAGACYGICVFRATGPHEREVYPIRMKDRLPEVRIPLRPADNDVVLGLQPLVNRCHEHGRYHLLDYRPELNPALSAEDAAWLDGILRAHGLRT